MSICLITSTGSAPGSTPRCRGRVCAKVGTVKSCATRTEHGDTVLVLALVLPKRLIRSHFTRRFVWSIQMVPKSLHHFPTSDNIDSPDTQPRVIYLSWSIFVQTARAVSPQQSSHHRITPSSHHRHTITLQRRADLPAAAEFARCASDTPIVIFFQAQRPRRTPSKQASD